MKRVKPLIVFLFLLFNVSLVYAHCDTVDGPVGKAAVNALDSKDFSKVQIWVGEKQEEELRKVYSRVLEIRDKGRKVKELADRYFIETVIRLHREAEGMSYTGIKPASTKIPVDIKTVDKSLKKENIEPLLQLLHDEIDKHVKKWFNKVLKARSDKDESVEAGRNWVDLYVKYVIYVHGLYKKIQAPPAHGVGEN